MDALVQDIKGRGRGRSLKFALYAACASIVMIFIAFTSAYIVRKAQGNWLEFTMPNVFIISTVVLLCSSASLQASYRFFLRSKEVLYKVFMGLTFVLGITFLVLQVQGWTELTQMGVTLNGNPAGSFVFVISGVHALHLLGGIGTLIMALLHAFVLPFKPTEKRKLRFELTLIYWHFMDFLWVYLIIFLMIA